MMVSYIKWQFFFAIPQYFPTHLLVNNLPADHQHLQQSLAQHRGLQPFRNNKEVLESSGMLLLFSKSFSEILDFVTIIEEYRKIS